MSNEDMISLLADHVQALEMRVTELTAFVGYLAQNHELTENDRERIMEAAIRMKPQHIARGANERKGMQQVGLAVIQAYGIARELKAH